MSHEDAWHTALRVCTRVFICVPLCGLWSQANLLDCGCAKQGMIGRGKIMCMCLYMCVRQCVHAGG